MLSQVRLWGPSWSKGRTAGHTFGREPSNDYFIKILFLLSKWFQTRKFVWEFPRGSYVKLSSAVAAILVGVLKCRTLFWKRTTQESFQQIFRALPPRWPPQCSCVVIESSFDPGERLQAPGSLLLNLHKTNFSSIVYYYDCIAFLFS
jgi:hypothetical protein